MLLPAVPPLSLHAGRAKEAFNGLFWCEITSVTALALVFRKIKAIFLKFQQGTFVFSDISLNGVRRNYKVSCTNLHLNIICYIIMPDHMTLYATSMSSLSTDLLWHTSKCKRLKNQLMRASKPFSHNWKGCFCDQFFYCYFLFFLFFFCIILDLWKRSYCESNTLCNNEPLGEIKSRHFRLQLCDVIQVDPVRAKMAASLFCAQAKFDIKHGCLTANTASKISHGSKTRIQVGARFQSRKVSCVPAIWLRLNTRQNEQN